MCYLFTRVDKRINFSRFPLLTPSLSDGVKGQMLWIFFLKKSHVILFVNTFFVNSIPKTSSTVVEISFSVRWLAMIKGKEKKKICRLKYQNNRGCKNLLSFFFFFHDDECTYHSSFRTATKLSLSCVWMRLFVSGRLF